MPNAYTAFLSLLPARPLQAGTVTAIDGAVRTVQLAGGALLRVRGDAAIADRVFVRDGAIEGPAPNLPIVSIEV